MIGYGADGRGEFLWEERLKGLEAGAEMCTLDATTIIASFGGKELLMDTSPHAAANWQSKCATRGSNPSGKPLVRHILCRM
jgi:3-keto-5-aminohexanoate cleavage enzyme